jgi:hypothetical protein
MEKKYMSPAEIKLTLLNIFCSLLKIEPPCFAGQSIPTNVLSLLVFSGL